MPLLLPVPETLDVEASDLRLAPGVFPLTLSYLHTTWRYIGEVDTGEGEMMYAAYVDEHRVRATRRLHVWND